MEALLSSAFGKPTASDISYGHIETMAEAVAAGAREAGVTVDIRRVPELVPDAVAASSHYKLNQKAPVATVEELPGYDAIIVGSGTRYGWMTSQMANFWDQTGGLWAQGHLIGKAGAAFTSTASQHGGQETTLMGIHNQPAAPRHGYRRPTLLFPGAAQAGRGDRRFALRRDDYRGGRRLAPAYR